MISRAISSTGVRFVVNDFTMRVNDGAPIALPFRPLFIRAGRDEIVCVPGEDATESSWGGKTYLVTAAGEPIVIAPWRARGNNPVAISDDGERVSLIGQQSAKYYTWHRSAGLAGPFDAPHPDNHIGFAVAEPLRMHAPVALTKLGTVSLRFPLKLWLDLGAWLFGEHSDVWYAYRKSDGEWFVVYDGPVTYPHTARLINGQMVAAVNGQHGGFFNVSDFRRVPDAATPPVADPVPLPSPIDTECRFHACAMGGWTGSGPSFVAGTVAWSAPAYDRRPRYEAPPWAQKEPGDVPFWGVPIGTESDIPKPYRDKQDQLDATIAFAKYRGCGVVAYGDQLKFEDTEAPEFLTKIRLAGVRAVWGQEMFADAALSNEKVEEEVEQRVRAAKKAGFKVVLISTARARFGKTLDLCPLVDKLIDQKFPSTIAGHVVFDGNGPGALASVRDFWTKRWATMPSGVVTPL